MRKARDRRGSRLIPLYPQLRACPEGHQPLQERYRKRRWIVQLRQQLRVISHFLECPTPECRQHAAVYRPEAEDVLLTVACRT